MRRTLLVLACVAELVLIAAVSPRAATQATTINTSEGGANDQFIGTWKLLRIDRLGPKGESLPTPAPPEFGSPNPVGILVYDPAGYMAATIMQSGRRPYAGSEPTPSEAQSALAGYVAYFGTYSVDKTAGLVTHHVQGSLNPSMESEQPRFFRISGNQLALQTPPSPAGSHARLVWERVPSLRQLTDEHHKFIGFWKIVASDRRTAPPSTSDPQPTRTGILCYTAAGYMAVHLMDPGRTKYAAAQPTPQEALAALRSYGSAYFGPYTIRQDQGIVVHHQLGMVNPGGGIGTDTLRGYRFVGDNRLILEPPAQTIDGQKVQRFVTWERLGPRAGMR